MKNLIKILKNARMALNQECVVNTLYFGNQYRENALCAQTREAIEILDAEIARFESEALIVEIAHAIDPEASEEVVEFKRQQRIKRNHKTARAALKVILGEENETINV